MATSDLNFVRDRSIITLVDWPLVSLKLFSMVFLLFPLGLFTSQMPRLGISISGVEL